jgi:hypothetical protein
MINTILTIAVIVILIWLLIAFLIPFLIIPNFIVFKEKIHKTKKIKSLANKLKAKSKLQTLKNTYKYVIKNYTGEDEKLKLLQIQKWFKNKPEKLLERAQFLPCHIQNFLIRTLLINTGQFKKSNFNTVPTISPFLTAHQYLIVKIQDQDYKVDPFFKVLKKI